MNLIELGFIRVRAKMNSKQNRTFYFVLTPVILVGSTNAISSSTY